MSGGAAPNIPLLLVVGDDGIGKTTLLAKMLPNVAEHHLRSEGLTTWEHFDKGPSTMAWRHVVDLSAVGNAPRVTTQSMRDMMLKRADAVLLTFAVDNPASFAHVEKYLAEIKASKRPFSPPIVLLGLRADSTHNVSRQEAEAFAAKFGLAVAFVSAEKDDLRELLHLLEVADVKASELSTKTWPSAIDMMVAGRNIDPPLAAFSGKDFVWPDVNSAAPATTSSSSSSSSSWWKNLVAKAWPAK